MGLTGRLARTCAAHPRRTLAAWAVAVLAALALVAPSLHGLSSEGKVIGSPPSIEAKNAIAKAFPATAAQAKADVVVVTSSRYTATSPQAQSFAHRLLAALYATNQVSHVQPAGVSADGHAALVSLVIKSDTGPKQVEAALARLSHGGFTATITGFRSSNYDFGQQSQQDLASGELAFGLPAAHGDPVDHRRAWPRRAALARVHALDVHREHAHGDGSRARDRLLPLRRLPLPRGASPRSREGGCDRARGRDREPGRPLQRQHVHRRARRDVHRP